MRYELVGSMIGRIMWESTFILMFLSKIFDYGKFSWWWFLVPYIFSCSCQYTLNERTNNEH